MSQFQTILHQLKIAHQFTLRDLKAYWPRFKRYFVNYVIFYPMPFAICYGYFLPKIGNVNLINTPGTSYVGSILFLMLTIAFVINLDFMLDLELDQLIDFQILRLKRIFLLFQKAFFYSSVIFIFALPFFAVSKFWVGDQLDFSNGSYVATFLMTLMASIFIATYNLFITCILKNSLQSRMFWRRCNFPLVTIGGFLAPYKVMASYSSFLAVVTLFNPLLYISEGFRSAVLGTDKFIHWSICSTMLVLFTIFFMALSNFFLKRKLKTI